MGVVVKDGVWVDMMKGRKVLGGENGVEGLIEWVRTVEMMEER